ncbi:MAG: hypothetical protein M3Z17_12110 [Gemmatimonadota bacterium]|nr:hypothetical protein [Gemmatimonadota bacterium]
MVDSVAKTLAAVVANGGAIDMALTEHGPMVIAQFKDPAGNVLGLHQEG